MSKASAFAAFNFPFPGTGIVASVGDGGMVVRIPAPQSYSHEAVRLTIRNDVAVAFAHWILDTFDDDPQATPS